MKAPLLPVVAHLTWFLLAAGTAQAQSVLPMSWDPFGVSQIAAQQTWREQRVRSVILQQYDRGCGPAALATILRYVLEVDVTEEQILQDMLLRKVEEEKLVGGFTFLDLMGEAERRGYETLAGRTSLDELRNLGLPAIVLLDRNHFRHFVVLWGVVDDRVHLGDPLIGNTTVSLAEFGQEWLGVVLIVLPPDEQMDRAVEQVQRHIDFLDQSSLRAGDPFSLAASAGGL